MRPLKKASEPSDYTDFKKITQILEISDFFRNLGIVSWHGFYPSEGILRREI
jgi:hypothetical protein